MLVSTLGLFDYDVNDRTRNNWKKLIVKRFKTSVAQHFFFINITTTWNALPYDVVNGRTVNTVKNRLNAHRVDNPPDVRLTGNTDCVPSLVRTVVVPAWLRANGHTIEYITTHNTANPLHHTLTQVQHWPDIADDSSEHLLAELGQLSLNTSDRKNWRCKLAQRATYYYRYSYWPSEPTVWITIWGVTQPGTGTWFWGSVSFLAGATD